MTYYAKIQNNIVTRVIVAEAEFFDNFVDNTPGQWIETSYSGSIRKNFAGIDYTYDATRDAFYAPKPYSSWTLVEDTCIWTAPTAMPDDGEKYDWDEDTTNWVEIV